MLKQIFAIAISVLIPALAIAQTGTPKTQSTLSTEINTNLPDNNSFLITPSILRQVLQDMNASYTQFAVNASAQSGGDMGAQINAAAALLPAGGGIIDARGLTGNQTLSTAVVIPANSVLLMGVAVITQSAVITVGQASSLVCQTVGIGQGNNFGQTRFFEAAGANLAEMVLVSGGQAMVSGCVFDGNKTNNASSGPNLNITGSHALIKDITTQNSHSAGWQISSSVGGAGGASIGTAYNIISIANTGDGLSCLNNNDWIISDSSFENNAGNAGIELQNCQAMRFVNYDIGGNVIGLWGYGTGGGGSGTSNLIIGAGQFGNQSAQDILLDGTSGTQNGSNSIVGGYFLGSSFRTSNTNASIEMHDQSTGANILSGLQIESTAGHTSEYAIYIHGVEGADTVGPVITQGTFGTSTFNVLPTTMLTSACDNQAATCQNQIQTLIALTSGSAISFSYGTGAYSQFLGSSTNTGFQNAFVSANNGTGSNANTQASFIASLLQVSNGFAALNAIGGANPTGQLTSGPGLTGGLSISAQSGTLTLATPSLSGVSKFSGQVVSTTGLPTIASGGCGAGANGAVVVGSTNQSGQITIGSSATTSCTISWSTTLTIAPNACVFSPMNAAAAAATATIARVSAPTVTNTIITGVALANANYGYICL